MATNKPRVQALLEHEVYKKFKILCELEDRTESKLSGKIITEYIKQYEAEHGEIKIESGD